MQSDWYYKHSVKALLKKEGYQNFVLSSGFMTAHVLSVLDIGVASQASQVLENHHHQS
jgi:hypothetical protein